MNNKPLGAINHSGGSNRRTDYLYRVSLKCLVKDDNDKILVVKEAGRENWDLPGGGMDHGENIKTSIAREMKEEVNLEGDFKYRIINIDEPGYLSIYSFWQLRLIFEVVPENMNFSVGDDSDELMFVDPETLKDSKHRTERWIYKYNKELA